MNCPAGTPSGICGGLANELLPKHTNAPHPPTWGIIYCHPHIPRGNAPHPTLGHFRKYLHTKRKLVNTPPLG